MRVIPIGVNSAFATGEYMEAITLVDLQEILQSGTENILEQVIKKLKTLYDPRLQSNFLLEFDNAVLKNKDATKIYVNKPVIRILVDAGGDARHGLKRRNLTVNDIDVFYVSHPHSDHIGGIECAALMSFFNPFYNQQKKHGLSDNNMNILSYILKGGNVPSHWKPILMGQEEVIEETWNAFQPGLNTLQGVRNVTADTYFDVVKMDGLDFVITEKQPDNTYKTWTFYTVESTHVVGGTKHMPSFGLFFNSDTKNIYFPTDTMLMMPPSMKDFYDLADIIYQDTETGFKSGVHSHIEDIKKVDPTIKKKLYLYHYNEEPVINADEFAGILRIGDVHEY